MHAIDSGYISPQGRGNGGGGLFEIVNFDILKCCFLTIGILSNLSQSSGNGISDFSRFQFPKQKELPQYCTP
jgi:hypothetical protein